MTSLQESLTRRQVAARLGAVGLTAVFAPIIGERGRASAHEDQTSESQEPILMPNPEGVPENLQLFKSIIDEEMWPKGIELLGIKPVIEDLENTPGAKLKIIEYTTIDEEDPEDPSAKYTKHGLSEVNGLNYTLNFYDGRYPFEIDYMKFGAKDDSVTQMIPLMVNTEGKLRYQNDEQMLPEDSLKTLPERYFKHLKADKITWHQQLEGDPFLNGDAMDDVKRDGLKISYGVMLHPAGLILQSANITAEKSPQTREEAQKKLNLGMKLTLARFSTPQV